MIRHYLVTGMSGDGKIVQIHIEIDPNDQKFVGPLKCCVNAASRNFWRAHLSEFSIDRVSSVKALQGSVPVK